MLEYSYKVELKRILTEIKGLEKDLFENPFNERAKRILKEKELERDWFEKQIKEGKDPGVRII